MSVLLPDHPLYKQVTEIFEKAQPAIFSMKIYFTNINNEKLEMPIEYVKRIDIFHEFISSYMENIELEFEVNAVQYQTLLKWYNELKCYIEMSYHDDKKDEDTGPYFKDSYRVLLKDMKDLTQMAHNQHLYEVDDPDKNLDYQRRGQMVSLKAQLIKPDAYILSKVQVNTILHNATVEQALWAFASACNIKKCAIFPPDNKKVYTNLKIPPMKSLATIFDYLHNTYGIYNAGGGLFYHDTCLYVFPCFVTEGKSEDTFHIYRTPPGFLMSAKGTTIVKEGDTLIFSNQLTNHNITSVKELESQGNSYFSMDSNKLFDLWGKHTEDGTNIPLENPEVFNADIGKGAVQETHTPIYHYNKNNEYLLKSKLSALGVSVLDIGWAAALPFYIKPFQKIVYHYEHKEEQRTLKCTCPSVTYVIRKETRLKKSLYTCFANIKLFTKEATDELD